MANGVSNLAKLTDEHRVFIVVELARFRAPAAIQRQLKEEFGVEVTFQSISHYNPNAARNKKRHNLAKRWVQLFDEQRRLFVTDLEANLPYAVKAVRVRELSAAVDHFRDKKNYMAMAEILSAIAKEVGNVHTNRREVTGKDGRPIQYQEIAQMTDDQIDAEFNSLVGLNPDQPGSSDTH